MKNKYVMISGLAMNEESDINKLSQYAKEGWILKDIKAGLFYKLEKGEPRNLVYSLDYQRNIDEEYLNIFKEAGWEYVVSVGDEIHFFSASEGTKPIYTDKTSEIDKYTNVIQQCRKGMFISGLLEIVLLLSLIISLITIKQLFLIVFALCIINMFIFIFNFMPCKAYKKRINQLEKCGKIEDDNKIDRRLLESNLFIGAMLFILGIIALFEKSYIAILFIPLGLIKIIEVKNKK